jgi:hypothetical protein
VHVAVGSQSDAVQPVYAGWTQVAPRSNEKATAERPTPESAGLARARLRGVRVRAGSPVDEVVPARDRDVRMVRVDRERRLVLGVLTPSV